MWTKCDQDNCGISWKNKAPPTRWCLLSLGDRNRAIFSKWSTSQYSWIGIDLLPIFEPSFENKWAGLEVEYVELQYETLRELLKR